LSKIAECFTEIGCFVQLIDDESEKSSTECLNTDFKSFDEGPLGIIGGSLNFEDS